MTNTVAITRETAEKIIRFSLEYNDQEDKSCKLCGVKNLDMYPHKEVCPVRSLQEALETPTPRPLTDEERQELDDQADNNIRRRTDEDFLAFIREATRERIQQRDNPLYPSEITAGRDEIGVTLAALLKILQ